VDEHLPAGLQVRSLDERGVYYADVRNYLMSDLYQIYTTDPEGNVVEINQEL